MTAKREVVPYWDRLYAVGKHEAAKDLESWQSPNQLDGCLIEKLGDVAGKRILEVGCGNGGLGLYLALRGAEVLSIDISSVAVQNVTEIAANCGLSHRLRAECVDALQIQSLGLEFDLICGKYILHHLEPFEDFARAMASVLRPGGRGVFIENSANNPLLILARKHLAGRFWIPKHGDDYEFPFEEREARILQREFGELVVHHPEFVFFKIFSHYILRHTKALKPVEYFNAWLDELIHRRVPSIHGWGYTQVLEFRKASGASR